jgi:hypothetical protein
MTPASVHYGDAVAVQAQRQRVMVEPFEAFPERFRGGFPTVKAAPTAVYINRPKAQANPS